MVWTLAGSGEIPSAETWCPRKSREETANVHLAGFMVIPNSESRAKRSSRW